VGGVGVLILYVGTKANQDSDVGRIPNWPPPDPELAAQATTAAAGTLSTAGGAIAGARLSGRKPIPPPAPLRADGQTDSQSDEKDSSATSSKTASSSKGGDGDVIRIRHYTNAKGLREITGSNVIKASDQNKVFAERASGKPLSPRDAEDKYGLKRGRGRHVIETDVPRERVNRVKNPRTKVYELQIDGDVPLDNASIVR
jgi:hypothetical protein